ncbi:MAG: class I mannose-6-phosphate isomerase, partial [Clostridia bacterium]|nr:class I mannose-6-phosphate isomerase [Clostridia bacterium]
MALLKLKPSFKDYLWGGHRLVEEYNKEYDGEVLAESWELSCHGDGPSYIENGEDEGKTLSQYIEKYGRGVLGTNCEKFDDFPILIKLIDAKDNLSVQVHPDNEYAQKNEGQYGKTEMWYVVDCKEGAQLYHGFKGDVSEEEFKARIKDNTLTDVLNAVDVKKGDVFFIESGTIHAIGANILIAEIQQNSNVTYRVYDYGRKGADGKERELHVDKAIEVTNRCAPDIKSFSPHIASCEYFTVDKLFLDGDKVSCVSGNVDNSSFVSILVL